jgi:hypothetical protein
MTDKTLIGMTRNDKRVLSTMLSWQGKRLEDCSKTDLLDCVFHMTQQVAYLQAENEKLQAELARPFYRRAYFRNRFYFRGWTWMGVINTVTACAANRVLVRRLDQDGKTLGWFWSKGTAFPPGQSVLPSV